MSLVWLVVALLVGYSGYRLLFDTDPVRKRAYFQTLLGYGATAALCVVAFRSGLPWLLVVGGLAYLAARGLPKLMSATQNTASAGEASRPPATSRMSREQALEVLGLEEGASENEVNERYRELMRKVHPDQGGSPYLATQLNAARRVLLG